MSNEIEKELKKLQIQYDKVLKERNELKKENIFLKRDLEEYQEYVKKGVEEHYKDFMQDYYAMLEECIGLNKYRKICEILKPHFDKTVNGFWFIDLDEYCFDTNSKENSVIKAWLENE